LHFKIEFTNHNESKKSIPPTWIDKLLNWLIAPHLREEVLGDLYERYALRAKRLGTTKARQRYWRDVLAYIRISNFKRKPTKYPTIYLLNSTMIRNYFKIGFRNLIKYKAFSLINIFGLAVAMSVCMLMILMYADQLSYDQFHKNKERVYRINTNSMSNGNLRATIPFPVAGKLKAYPFIEEVALLRRGFGGDAVHNLNYSEMRGFFTTSSFFKIFSYELEAGNQATALEKPNSLVITHKVAKKLFGKRDPIGKTIHFSQRGLETWSEESHSPVDWGLFTVTGVFADHDYKSHLSFDAIVSASTLEHLYKENKIEDLAEDWTTDHQAYTYVLLSKTANEKNLNDALAQVSENLKLSKYPAIQKSKLAFQSLTKLNPGPVVNNTPTNSLPLFVYYILGGLVLVIMFAACLNYTSLSIARSITRSGEIGLRKVIGA
jgi:putative ABC transport system permease protein